MANNPVASHLTREKKYGKKGLDLVQIVYSTLDPIPIGHTITSAPGISLNFSDAQPIVPIDMAPAFAFNFCVHGLKFRAPPVPPVERPWGQRYPKIVQKEAKIEPDAGTCTISLEMHWHALDWGIFNITGPLLAQSVTDELATMARDEVRATVMTVTGAILRF